MYSVNGDGATDQETQKAREIAKAITEGRIKSVPYSPGDLFDASKGRIYLYTPRHIFLLGLIVFFICVDPVSTFGLTGLLAVATTLFFYAITIYHFYGFFTNRILNRGKTFLCRLRTTGFLFNRIRYFPVDQRWGVSAELLCQELNAITWASENPS